MSRFVESITRTNKLICSDCYSKINKGTAVVFELNDSRRMKNVYCEDCSADYERNVIDDEGHPHDSESLGQWI